jgi:hypothetical protein
MQLNFDSIWWKGNSHVWETVEILLLKQVERWLFYVK